MNLMYCYQVLKYNTKILLDNKRYKVPMTVTMNVMVYSVVKRHQFS